MKKICQILTRTAACAGLCLRLLLAQNTNAEDHPASEPWLITNISPMDFGCAQPTLTVLTNGEVLITGGIDGNDYSTVTGLPTAKLYDPGTKKWVDAGTLTDARYYHTGTFLPDGRVLVAGGCLMTLQAGSYKPLFLASAELSAPGSGKWSLTGAMRIPRCHHTATLMPNGQVLVAGGINSNVLASAEFYDPATGVWTMTGSLHTPRYGQTATLLRNGKVLLAGGTTNGMSGKLGSAEIYDPATGQWTDTDPMICKLAGNSMTLLPDGKVLVAGGFDLTNRLASAELYDPTTGHWSATGSMNKDRVAHAAALLSNQMVLVAGGYAGGYAGGHADNSAEMYDPASGIWQTIPVTNPPAAVNPVPKPNQRIVLVGTALDNVLAFKNTDLYDPLAVKAKPPRQQ
jgi:N-acetylneuraminic acid mutarotase